MSRQASLLNTARFQIVASDNFTRANGALSAPWTNTTGFPANFTISSNTAIVSNLSTDSSYINSTITWPNDHWATCIIGTPQNTSDGHGYGVSCRNAGAAQSCYLLVGSAAGYALAKYVTGTVTGINENTTTTFANGDILTLLVQGTTLTGFKNWVQFVQSTDASLTTGSAGIYYSSTENTGASLLSWSAGYIQ